MAATTTGRRRWVHPHANDGLGTGFNPRLTRAYAEGRRDMLGSGTNPHVSGTPAYTAYALGYDNLAEVTYQFEAAT